MRSSQRRLLSVVALGALPFLAQAQTAPADSPFLPANPASVPDPRSTSTEPFQLSAIGVVGGKTFVSIYETAEKHSRWIAVGGTLGAVQIMSCDVDAEQVVIRVGGQLKTLTLPKASVAAGTAAVSPPSSLIPSVASETTEAKPAEASYPQTDEEKAREARMLVTDLLEIGMQQRKAYEEAAQKKAAEERAKTPAAN